VLLHKEALAAKRRLLPEDHLDTGQGHGWFAGVLRHFEEAVAVLAKSLPAGRPDEQELPGGRFLAHTTLSLAWKAWV
jgi:hypothetical protein